MLWPFLHSVHLNHDDNSAKVKEYMDGGDKMKSSFGKIQFFGTLKTAKVISLQMRECFVTLSYFSFFSSRQSTTSTNFTISSMGGRGGVKELTLDFHKHNFQFSVVHHVLKIHKWSELKPAKKNCGNPAWALTPHPTWNQPGGGRPFWLDASVINFFCQRKIKVVF